MIIYNISDGLGNQLFQYATARVLSDLNGDAELYLKIDSFSKRSTCLEACLIREYHLDKFDISIAGYRGDIERGIGAQESWNQLPRIDSLKRFSSPLLWDPRVLTLRGDLYVESFGQSWRHLARIEGALRRELTFTSQARDENARALAEVSTDSSVSIHVRRTDYLSSGYAVCDPGYYDDAMCAMRSIIPQAAFFVFSDDPEWAQKHWMGHQDVRIINHNSASNCHEDLRLMSGCRAHIIANSTFSWWGAWLNPRPDKVVIMPKIWKRSGESSVRMALPGWIVI